jgi:TatD DNase family protein
MLQDTHIHIQDIKNAHAIEVFLATLKAADFGRVFNCAITPADWPVVRELSRKHDWLIPGCGFHPWFVDLANKGWEEKLSEHLAAPEVFAGEMGLDKARKNIDFGLQTEIFAGQLVLARKFNKPFMVHCVRAWNEVVPLIKQHAAGLRFLMHSFNGTSEIANEIVKMGGFFSVTVRQFLKPEDPFKAVFEALPLNRILIETDFPYQVKWTAPAEYVQAVRSGYETAAAWKGLDITTFTQAVYDNGTVFADRAPAR